MNERHPFIEDPRPSEVTKEGFDTVSKDEILELPNREDIVIRKFFHANPETLRFFKEQAEPALLSLQAHGVDVANFRAVVGEGTGKYDKEKVEPQLYLVIDRIKGENLAKLVNRLESSGDLDAKNELAEKLDNMYAKYIAYLHDTVVNEKDIQVVADVKTDNFVYGKAKDDEQDKLYLVDLGHETLHPNIRKWTKQDLHMLDETYFSAAISSILHNEKLGRFEKSRIAAYSFMEDVIKKLLDVRARIPDDKTISSDEDAITKDHETRPKTDMQNVDNAIAAAIFSYAQLDDQRLRQFLQGLEIPKNIDIEKRISRGVNIRELRMEQR